LGLQPSRNQRPQCAEKRGGGDRDREKGPPWQDAVQRKAGNGNAKAGYVALPFAADIEQATMKRHRHRQSGKDEGCGVVEGEGDPLHAPETAFDQYGGGAERVLTNQQHREPSTNKGRSRMAEKDQAIVHPGWQLGVRRAHATVSFCSMPAMSRPSSASLASGPRSPTMRPSNITRILSESARISSSSTETSRTALPASRMAISL